MIEIKLKKEFKLILSVAGIIVSCVAIFFIINNLSDKNEPKDDVQIKEGVAVLKELETQDVVQIEEKIDSIQSTNGMNNNQQASSEVNYKSKFSSSVIAGDSRAEGISAYGFLTQSSVVAQKGRNLSTAKKNGDINTIIGLSPQNVFLTYGINDIGCYNDSEPFIKIYKEVIDEIKTKLPKTNIYVCSILPVQSFTLKNHPNFKNIAQWNADIEQLCKDTNVVYLDANSIVEESDYEVDGIHYIGTFQKKWLNFFIQKANL